MEPTHNEMHPDEDTLRPEYDFSKLPGVRGKYYARFRETEPMLRILHRNGTVEEGMLAELSKKYELREPEAIKQDSTYTIVAIPTELVPQVQELIVRGQQPKNQ